MYLPLLAHISFILLFMQLTCQTNIEYWDSDTVDPIQANVLQKFRFLTGGECCVPVDLSFPLTGRRERFVPYKIVFEYFALNQLYVFANADNRPACRGPPVGFYQRDATSSPPREYVKNFIRRPTQRWSGALFHPPLEEDVGNDINGTVLSHNNDTDPSNTPTAEGNTLTAREPPPMNIVYPWSISYRGLVHYQSPRGSLDYVDFNRRSRIRGVPQFGELRSFATSMLTRLMDVYADPRLAGPRADVRR